AKVVHRLEVLAPADVDGLEDDEALEVAHQPLLDRIELLLAFGIRVEGVLDELFHDRVALEPAELLDGDAGAVERLHRLHETAEIPLVVRLVGGVLGDDVRDHLGDPPLLHELGEILAVQHVVVLEDVLARDEVLLLDLLLGVLDLAREDPRLHRLVLGELEALHDVVDAVAGEEAHELVLPREVEARLARVALAAGATAQLVVDAARLVALRAEDVEAAELSHAVVDLDVHASAGHVRRDRDRARLTGVLDDLRLA